MNMIEKVARAIALSNRAPDSDDWPVYVNDAKAAIAAMREPTPEMLDMARHVGPTIDKWQSMIDEALHDD